MHSPKAEGDGISEQRGDKVSKYQVAFLPPHLPPTPKPYLLKQLQGWREQKAPPARQDLQPISVPCCAQPDRNKAK